MLQLSCYIFLEYLSSELMIFLRIECHLAAKTVTNSAVFVYKSSLLQMIHTLEWCHFSGFVVIRAIFIVYG